jgi:hypothetical protein
MDGPRVVHCVQCLNLWCEQLHAVSEQLGLGTAVDQLLQLSQGLALTPQLEAVYAKVLFDSAQLP